MPSKYSILEDFIHKNKYREEIWREIMTLRASIENHKQAAVRLSFLLKEDEERVNRADASYARISKELRDLENLLCKED
jgi:hypothetical protein